MSMVQGLPPSYSESQGLTKLTSIDSEDQGSDKIGTITIQEINDAQYEEEKKAIYSHPLLPLLKLLFEKCELASLSAECPSADSFTMDIQNFVHHQEKANKPFFSENTELDNLMVKAIQVLRIHLLELEKVNELCKDFCNRYIACLKGKLQSEQLLRVDTEFDDFEMGSPPTSGGQLPSGGVNSNVMIQPQSMNVGTLNQVYQMVQTPQGLVAQPIQIQTTPVQSQLPSSSLIQGTTPMSQIGVVPHTSTSNTPTALANNLDDSDDDDPLGKKKNKRGVLPKQATQVMKSWLFQHIVHPYPTEDEKRQIANQTNLTLLQVNNWFINARRRILQPMLDATNPEPAKKPKSKPQNRPLQRFWPESIANLQPQLPASLTSTAKSDDSSKMSNSTTVQSSPLIVPVVTMPVLETKAGEDVLSDSEVLPMDGDNDLTTQSVDSS